MAGCEPHYPCFSVFYAGSGSINGLYNSKGRLLEKDSCLPERVGCQVVCGCRRSLDFASIFRIRQIYFLHWSNIQPVSCSFGSIFGNFIAVFELRLTEVDHATAPNISHHIFTGHLDSVSTEQ